MKEIGKMVCYNKRRLEVNFGQRVFPMNPSIDLFEFLQRKMMLNVWACYTVQEK